MSRDRFWWLIAAALLALALALVGVIWLVVRSTPVSAQGERMVSLPLVAHGYDAQAPSIVTLVAHDTMFVSATTVPGTCRVLLTYIDRQNGNLLHVVEDVGDRLIEVPLPQGVTLADAEPDDVLPGLKHGSGAPVVVCGRLRVYANVRVEDGGPFVLQRLEMAIPAPPQR